MRYVLRSTALCALVGLPAVAAGQVAGLAGFQAVAPFPLGRFELNTTATAERIGSSIAPRTPLSLESTLRLPIRSGGLWLGTAVEGAPEVDTMLIRPLARFGAWQWFRMVGISVEASTHVARLAGRKLPPVTVPEHINSGGTFDTVIAGGVTPSHDAMWSDVEGRVSWMRGRTRLDATMGMRPSIGDFAPATWSNVRASYQINSNIALVGAGGSEAARVALGIPASRFASIALRFSPWGPATATNPPAAATFAVRPASAGSYRVTYLAANAKSVELSGDFDGWKAVTLTRGEHDVWEATIPLTPGTYRVNVRVNGERWFAPVGLPQAHDDFNGTVGVLVVP